MGNYFDMDPTFWRVLFFFLFLFGCSGLLIYIILWIVMPGRQVSPNNVENMAQNNTDAAEPKKNNGMTAGLLLIGIGIIGLLARYIPQISWQTAWPIVLIILGIVILIPKNKKS